MGIKKLIKRTGRFLFSLKQEDEALIRQAVLITDNGYCALGDLRAGIKKMQNYFPAAKISVLTLPQRSALLGNEFPGLKFIVSPSWFWPHRYAIALQLFFLGNKNFDYILNFSLDLSPLIVQLFLFRSRIILYNQWGQWCSLRLRKVSQIFQSPYHKQTGKNSIKDVLKRAGLFFVLLTPDDEQGLSHNILVVDDGRMANQLTYTVRRIRESLPFSRLTLLTLSKYKELESEPGVVKIIRPDSFGVKKFRIARHLPSLRKTSFDYVVLLSLDIAPIMGSIIFLRGKILLSNQWHQLWAVRLKPAGYYLMLLPRMIAKAILKTVVFIYLSVNVLWIFFVRSANILKLNLLKEGN
jgi:hypothetical protein